MRAVLLGGMEDLSEADWNALSTGDDPFVSRDFLGIAEATGAAGELLAWKPRHVALRGDDGQLAGLLPLYLRHHWYGDFAHDWGWAEAWQQAGLNYYPKLVSGVPFTPSPGPRLLRRAGLDAAAQAQVGGALIEAAKALVAETGASSWQCLFVGEAERDLLQAAGLLLRRGVQFHWMNRGYRDFADFLDGFSADKRKKLKRERRSVREAGLRIEAHHGDAINGALWAAIHRHYRDTFLRYGSQPAFTPEFFRRVGEALGRRMVVFVAWQGEGEAARPVASAICYRNATTLFGRHWGTDIDCPGLHFELCYYSGIEYAIAEGLQRFEPGAGGEHKLTRGFEPVSTWSGFWIADPRMRELVARYLAREDGAMLDYAEEMAERLPFKAGG